jgi:hypothetical protein
MGFVCGSEGWRRKSTSKGQEQWLETGSPGRWPKLVTPKYWLERWRPIIYGSLGATKYPATDKSTWRNWLPVTSKRHCRSVKVTFIYSCYSGSLEICFSKPKSYRPAASSLGKTFRPWAEISVREKWWKLVEGERGPTIGYSTNTSNNILDWIVRAKCCVVTAQTATC